MSQTKFAEYIGTSKKTITYMKQHKQIIMIDKKVDVKKSIELLKSIGRRFDKDNKMIVSNTSKADENETAPNLLNTEFDYPTLSDMDSDEHKQYPYQIMKEVADENDIDLSMDKILTKEIDALEPFEATKIKTFWQGMQERLKYEILADQYIAKSDVYDEQFNTARVVRDSLMGIPNRVSHQLLGQTDIHHITSILEIEIHKTLEGLSR